MDKSDILATLVKEACKYPPGHKERQKRLTQIIKLANKKLWKENTIYYEDALQETWIYFCQNVCEGKTTNPYDPERATIVTWINNYLKWRLKDGFIKQEMQKKQTASIQIGQDNQIIDPVDNLPAPTQSPCILEEIEAWVRKDPEYKLRQTHLDKHSEVTCQVLILHRLPLETPWKNLSEEYGISAGTLSSFYQRKCKPLLRDFSKSQGYI
ncbi:hypothetical protein NIES4102_25440 [Chondrocystis sp. NIES-4102]|nr:hypothetical protein NIES4102_25440 [Chondrocystis sp. NIES-4102]